MYQRLLIPLDGSETSKWVLTRARKLLEIPRVFVKLVTVVRSSEERAEDLGYRTDPRHKETREWLRAVCDDLSRSGIDAHAEVLFGDPAEEIVREAARGHHDLIPMTTHGRTGMDRILFGSEALKILQSSPIPLLLFKPFLAPGGKISPVERTDPVLFRRILVPIDGSETAEEILPWVENMARVFDSKLHLFTSVPGGDDGPDRIQEAREHLKKRATVLGMAGFKVEQHVRVGPAWEEALRLINEFGLDAVAMTTHGRSGMGRAVYGSVAEKILTRAEIPMLVLRNKHLRLTLPDMNEVSRAVGV